MNSFQSENIEEISADSSQQRTEVKPMQKICFFFTNYDKAQPRTQVKVTVTEVETEGPEKDLVCLCCP